MRRHSSSKWILSPDFIFSFIGLILMFLYYYDIQSRAKEYESLLITLVFYSTVLCFIVITYRIYKRAKNAQNEDQSKGIAFKNIISKKQLKMILAIALYLPGIKYLGFVISTFVFLMYMQTMLELANKKMIFLISLVTAILLDLVFVQLFQIKLPSGLLNVGSGVLF